MKKNAYHILVIMLFICFAVVHSAIIDPPGISYFYPSFGPVGSTVSIIGKNFSTIAENNIIYFGAVRAEIKMALDTLIIVNVPNGATFLPITITTNGLTAFSAKPFIVTFLSQKKLDSASFAPKIDFPTAANPDFIVVKDFNGDGKTDIAVSCYQANANSILINSSTKGVLTSQSFTPKVDYQTGNGPWSLSVNDIDGDGKPELINSSVLSNKISILKNLINSGQINSNSFASNVDIITCAVSHIMAVGDLDGDGKPDMVIPNYYNDSISVYRNVSSTGTITAQSFSFPVKFKVGIKPNVITIGDIDGDGKQEIIVTNEESSNISILRNISTPGSITEQSFSPKIDLPTSAFPVGAAIGDIDGDGKLDLTVTNFNSNSVSIFRNMSSSGSITSGSFATPVVINTGMNPNTAILGDLDGDGKLDLVIPNYGSATLSILKNNNVPGNISVELFDTRIDLLTEYQPFYAAIADVDGDGLPDITVVNSANNSISVYKNIINIPSTPTNLNATSGHQQVTLSWKKVGNSNIRTYRVYGSTTTHPSSVLDSTASSTDTTKKIKNLLNQQKYYFRVTAVDSSGLESNYSNEVSAIPNNVPPVAVFIPDTTMIDTLKQLTASLTYSSIGSYDLDGTIDSVQWFVNSQLKSIGTSFTYNYGPGTNEVMLIVKDENGAVDTSMFVVSRLLFKNVFSGPILSGVSLLNNAVMYSVASGDAIYKMNANGVIDFNLQVSPGEIRTASIGDDGSVYLASLNTNIYAFSKFGTAMWPAIALGGQATATPTVDFAGNRIYIGVSNKNFLSIQRNTGDVKSSFLTDAPIKHSAVMTKDRRLIFSTIKGTVYGIDMTNQSDALTSTWSLNIGDSITTSPAVDFNGYIYVGTSSGKIVKILMKNNQLPNIVWQKDLLSPVSSSPVIDGNGILYIGTVDGNMNAINTVSGSIIWKYPTLSAVRSTASISTNGSIYFGNDAGKLFALDTAMNLRWILKMKSPIAAPILAHNGIIYCGTTNGELIGVYDGDIYSQDVHSNSFLNKTVIVNRPMWGTYQGNNVRNGIQDDTLQILSVESNIINAPVEYTLLQNFPNPFNPSTTIQYGLPVASEVSIKIYNILGQCIKDLVSGYQQAGWHEVTWSAYAASGIYFYRIYSINNSNPVNKISQMKKMVLLK